MAKLLLISSDSLRSCNEIGDIIGVFDDDHVFSPSESIFDVKSVPEVTVEKVIAEFDKLEPDYSDLTKEELKIVINKKHPFRVSDDTKSSIADMCECKIKESDVSAIINKR